MRRIPCPHEGGRVPAGIAAFAVIDAREWAFIPVPLQCNKDFFAAARSVRAVHTLPDESCDTHDRAGSRVSRSFARIVGAWE